LNVRTNIIRINTHFITSTSL